MINNFEEYLTLENIFLLSNWGVIPFWLLLLFSPNSTLTRFLVHSVIIPLILGIAYIFVVYQIYLNDNYFGYICSLSRNKLSSKYFLVF